MTSPATDRRLMRLLAAVLTALWAATAIVIAIAYRPGGAVDIVVTLACFVPVAIADLGVVRPPKGLGRLHRTALIWVWILAVLLVCAVMYGIAVTLQEDRPRSLVPSFEAAYAGALALFAMSFFSVVGLVHRRMRVRPLERRATIATAVAATGLTLIAGLAFLFVGFVNDRELRAETTGSRFGPTEGAEEPPFCDDPLALGANAVITIEAKSSLDNEDRGMALLEGQRSGRDESWVGSWAGPDGEGQQAYLRLGPRAWRIDSDDPRAPGTNWTLSDPDPFELLGLGLTMDGPPHAVAAAPRGELVAEDLGLEHIDGARARHCRTFIDGPTALGTFLPLRWLLLDTSDPPGDTIAQWRGELDWWVFSDGELGMATVEVSGSRAETEWDAEGVRAVLEARLEAIDRTVAIGIAAPVASGTRALATPGPAAGPAAAPTASATTAPSATPRPAAAPTATPAASATPGPAVPSPVALESGVP